MKTRYRLLGFTTVLFCLFLLNSLPLAQATTDHFSDSLVLVIGKSNFVGLTAIWLFGFKFVLNKQVIIQVTGEEDEKITALILPSKIGFYFGHENMTIQMNGAVGLLFWGEKSRLSQNVPARVFTLCKAKDIWVTYD